MLRCSHQLHLSRWTAQTLPACLCCQLQLATLMMLTMHAHCLHACCPPLAPAPVLFPSFPSASPSVAASSSCSWTAFGFLSAPPRPALQEALPPPSQPSPEISAERPP